MSLRSPSGTSLAVVDSLTSLNKEDGTVTGASTPAAGSAHGDRSDEVAVWEEAVGTPPPFSPPAIGDSFKVSSVI